jgi:RNA recognition motif-containing protein
LILFDFINLISIFINAKFNSSTVGFADFEDSESASLAMETLQGYKWAPHVDKGISINLFFF